MESDLKKLKIILSAEDDDDDRLLIQEGFKSSKIASELFFTENGQDLLDYLRHQGKYSGGNIPSPRPDLILLDLNMPKRDGRDVLREIKSDPALRGIPIVVLTTSNAYRDIINCYNLGANSFISKPESYDDFARMADAFCGYWMRLTTLPQQEQQRGTP